MAAITILVFAHNSADEISEAIESARFLSDTIAVVDIASEDETAILAKKANATVLTIPYTSYVEPARGEGIKNTQTDWVFILDADERITQELANEIKKVVKTNACTHYKIPRKNLFGKKKWLRYGGWWPDYQIRLLNKKFFLGWPKEIHSTPKIEGGFATLKNPLIHFFHGDFSDMVKKTTVFEDIEAELLFEAKRRASTATFFRKYFGELYRRLIRQFGFLDGEIGIIESIYQAFSKAITYLFLYEKQNRSIKRKNSRSL